MITIDFTVPGKPVGKERPRVTRRGTYTPQKTREYEKNVRREFLKAMVLNAPDGYHHRAELVRYAEVYITAFFGVPESWSLKKKNDAYGNICTKKPDADNIEKVICDALNGSAYSDDAFVTKLTIAKRYCGRGEQPRVEVTVAMQVEETQ